MKRKIAALIMASVFALGMTACGTGTSGTKTRNTSSKTYSIGISQFAEHGSLDDCRKGFIDGLKEEGIEEGKNLKINIQNANADTSTAATIADSFVSSKVDLICAIATPSAMSAYNSAGKAGIPVIYSAVSDPVAAELAQNDKTPVGEITGTSDALPVEDQLKMIRLLCLTQRRSVFFIPHQRPIQIPH